MGEATRYSLEHPEEFTLVECRLEDGTYVHDLSTIKEVEMHGAMSWLEFYNKVLPRVMNWRHEY